MPTALLLNMHHLGDWAATAKVERVPGGPMPYGMQALRRGYDLDWTDAQAEGSWTRPLLRKAGAVARTVAPGLSGTVGAVYAAPRLRDADVVLSVFENAGLGLGRLQRLVPGGMRTPHVLMACWLAEDCLSMSSFERRSIRRSLRGVRRVLVFSTNQVQILHDVLGVPLDDIAVVPFGVDTDYYDPALVSQRPGGGGLVAVGGDSRRDYATLFEAVRITGRQLTVVCRPRNLEGLVVPPQVTVRHDVFDDAYRRLLHSADLVVTPTVAPAYPSGQSVVLEAMSMGRPTLTTASAAMAEYVQDGVTGMLMAPRDPHATASLIGRLLEDAGLRARLAHAGRSRVLSEFTVGHLWGGVQDQLDDLVREQRPAASSQRGPAATGRLRLRER